MDRRQKTPAAQGVRNLERLVNGKATINDLRKEAGLAPIEGGDELLVKRDTVVISEHDDVVFVMGKDGKSGKVAVLQAGVLIPAQIWTTRDWGRYIARRIASSAKGHFMGACVAGEGKRSDMRPQPSSGPKFNSSKADRETKTEAIQKLGLSQYGSGGKCATKSKGDYDEKRT